MFAKGTTMIGWFEQWVPKHLAVPEDKIGLQVGSLNKEIKKMMITLEVTEQVVEEAIEKEVDLIFAHHAVIFRPLKHIQTDSPSGRLLEKLIQHQIAVYIAHTNLDIASGGINDMMADALGLQNAKVLFATGNESLYKLAVYVPNEHGQAVFDSLMSSGAGAIGDYSHCSFQIEGTGTFKPGEDTNPFIGSQGKLEKVKEIRIETIVPESKLKKCIQAMKKSHPYEEPAYDIYPLQLEGPSYGLGRVGKLEHPITLREFNERVKKAFGVKMTRVVGNLDTVIKKAAVLGGQGARYVSAAQFQGADVYVTGDIDYHTAQDALAAGICLIDPGHHTEEIMKQPVAQFFVEQLKQSKYRDTQILISETLTDPFQFA